MRRSLFAAVLATGLLGAAALSASADGVPAHEHFIETASGERVLIGPQVCSHPELHNAFHQFHEEVHRGMAGAVFSDPNQPIGSFTTVNC